MKQDVKPFIAPFRPIPFHLKEKVSSEIQAMLDSGIIERYNGPVSWISNIVIVPKADWDEVRLCYDLRRVNTALYDTKKPVPTVESIKTRFTGMNYFSKVDFTSVFSQVEIEPSSRHLLVFRVDDQLFTHTRLPMGSLPVSREFMGAVAPRYADIPGVSLLHDDRIIAGRTEAEHYH